MSRRSAQQEVGAAVVFGVLALLFLGTAAIWLVATSEAQGGPVVINELQASNDTTIADGAGDFPDWIELRNITNAPVDLSGWTIGDAGAQWPIPFGTTIPANGFLLIWASDKGDPADPDFPGPPGELHTNFRLSSQGDSVLLTDGLSVVDTISYDFEIPPDQSYGRDASGTFVVFTPVDVTPNAANGSVTPPTPTPTPTPVAPPGEPSIVINEVMQANATTIADGAGDFEDWFELYNPTCETVDLSGWQVRDSANSWPLPAGTVLAPSDVLLIWASNKGDPDNADFPGPAGELHTDFRLSAAGESVFLVDADGFLIATVNPGPSIDDESFGLNAGGAYQVFTAAEVSPNALNAGQVPTVCTPTPTPTPPPPPTATPTPGGPTATPTPPPTVTPTPTITPTPTVTPTPSVTPTPTAAPPTATPVPCASSVRINEVQTRNDSIIADGDGDFSDWIELFNVTTETVDLSGWTISDSGNTFVLAPGTSIEPGGFLLIWASDKGDPDDAGFPGPAGEIHANFRLSGSGESVTLASSATCRVDRVEVPALQNEESYGVTRSGTLGVFSIGFATPLAPNGDQFFSPRSVCYSPDSPVRVNRVVAKNDGLLLDGDGDASDFIELKNFGPVAVDISVWQLSDESDRWIIPGDTIIGAGETLIIWASGKGDILEDDFPGPPGELHANFKLSSDGEELIFAEPSECIVDQFTYPALGSDQAYGFDATGQRVVLLPGVSADPCAAPGSVQIIAVQSKNDSTRADEDGEFGDWVELRNTTEEDIDLTGWVIADDNDAWVVPEGVTLAAETDVLIWADEKDRGGPDAPLHTNFKLSGDGETVSVGSSLDCPVDALVFPALEDDQVYRLGDDGTFAIEGDAPAKEEKEEKDDEGDETGDVTIVATCLAINELMAKNDSTLEDAEGEFGDWIELVNLGDDTIDLSGYVISDEKDSWTIPDGVEIDGGEFLLLWADETDTDDADEELHTNFKLGSEGEPITIVDADDVVVASISGYPELDDDEAFGVNDDGDYAKLDVGDATPGDGPVSNECDFEVQYAAAGASADADGDEADADDSETESSDADDGDADETASDPAPLARTGTNARTQSLVAQLMVLMGCCLVACGGIARRRAANERS